MKQLIEDLISAMEYHVEQTRPIHSTTVALQAAREALKAMPTHLACDCYQGQVCHVCDPITPSKQSAQQEPAFWYYTLVVEGQVVGENFTTVNWDTRVEPFGRYDIDHGGKVTKQPLYTTPPAQPAPVQEPVASAAYDMVDRFLRNNLSSDADYAEYSAALDALYTTPPAAQRKPLTNEQKRELIKKSELWDMHIHIGWYSAPAKSFVEKTIQLIADIEAAHGITKGQP
jgi:hypothetical protein